MADRLKGKIAIVFGAGYSGPGWGNGKAAAVAYAREGAGVACIDLNRDAAAETAAIIASEGGKALALAADVTNLVSVEACIAETTKHFGRLDGLVNNAGLMVERRSYADMSEELYDEVMNLNARSVIFATKASCPPPKTRDGPAITGKCWSALELVVPVM